MRDTKRCLVLFSFYDRTGIARFLEEQALKGWLLEKISAFGWKFRRIEPKKISYAVTFFAKASAFDPEPSEEQLRFQDFCEHTGWRLAASSAQMQVFYNEEEHPIPVETDAVVEVESIHAAAKRSYLTSYYMLLGAGLLQAVLFFSRLFSDPVEVLSSNSSLFTGLCWMFMLLLVLVEIAGYHRWRRQAKKQAELDGSFLETKSHKNFQLWVIIIMLTAFGALLLSYGGERMRGLALASILLVLVITAVVVALSEIMKRLKVSANINRILTFAATIVMSLVLTGGLVKIISANMFRWREADAVETYEFRGMKFDIYKDELPLTVEDLLETDYDGYSYEWHENASIIASENTAIQRPRMDGLEQPDLEYTIVEVKLPALYDWCRQAMLDDFAHNYGRPESDFESWKEAEETDPAPWGAKEAYQLKLGGEPMERYLLCYENRIIEIDFDWDVSQEQMKVAGEKLNNP